MRIMVTGSTGSIGSDVRCLRAVGTHALVGCARRVAEGPDNGWLDTRFVLAMTDMPRARTEPGMDTTHVRRARDGHRPTCTGPDPAPTMVGADTFGDAVVQAPDAVRRCP
jgi:hypothetical protein